MGVLAVLMFASPMGAQAAALTPAGAEGDSYGVFASASINLLAPNQPVNVGPVAPSYATVPPGTTAGNQSGTVISGPAGPLNPIVSAVNVTNDTSKATTAPVAKTDCQPNQATQDGFTGPLSGGNACSTVASAELLNTGGTTVDTALPVISATGVFAQSTTQQCDPSQGLPTGSAKVVSLNIQGNNIAIPPTSGNPPSIAPNTIKLLNAGPTNIATIIFNEQKLDNKSGGQGLTVNAIHIFLGPALNAIASADVIIGHAHSDAICTTPPTKQPCDVAGASDPRCGGNLISKTDDTGTETANPGQTVTYTLNIDTKKNAGADVQCVTTTVTDTLPPGFSFVSASGDLGTPSVAGQVLTWYNGTGINPSKAILTETIVVKIGADVHGTGFSNRVETESSCGSNEGSSPGITVPPPNNSGQNGAGTQPAAAAAALPFTGTGAPQGRVWLAIGLLGLGASIFAGTVLRRARRTS